MGFCALRSQTWGIWSRPGRGGEAWRQEFWPPCCSETVVTIVRALVRRAAWLPTPAARSAYLTAVPKVCVDDEIVSRIFTSGLCRSDDP